MKQIGKKYRSEIILIAFLLSAACAMLLWQRLHQKPAFYAEVSVGGQVVQTLDLNMDGEYTIESPSGGTNHLVVRDGAIWCDQATCPDKVCVHQGRQNLEGAVIVCLPNEMIVQISREENR
ncbi:MAG: NusG domain II-containing protein [Lachnospiraceae bacterium]|nr:NusG domain II-containing protein [Lachnospiraceae bacterium]